MSVSVSSYRPNNRKVRSVTPVRRSRFIRYPAALGRTACVWYCLLIATADGLYAGTPPPAGLQEAATQSPADTASPVIAVPRFGSNSPFQNAYQSPVGKTPKQLWARSCLWETAPELEVEQWLGDPPETGGKFRLVMFWATWCGQCKKTIPRMNEWHRRFGDKLAVIGISDETEHVVRSMQTPEIAFHLAVDSRARMKSALEVTGIPHVIIIEPGGSVVWEGFPLLQGYELTTAVLEQILSRGGRKH